MTKREYAAYENTWAHVETSKSLGAADADVLRSYFTIPHVSEINTDIRKPTSSFIIRFFMLSTIRMFAEYRKRRVNSEASRQTIFFQEHTGSGGTSK